MGNDTPTKLHAALKDAKAKGRTGDIDLYERFIEIKEAAKQWLKDLGKNGYEHSDRLEHYLVNLTGKLLQKSELTHAEIFVLLCAAYMHDLGYWHNGQLQAHGHPERSREIIENHIDTYLLGDFPPFEGKVSRVAQAVGWVCYGHSEETYLPLANIPNDFPDQSISDEVLNLRKLAALLRLADEADDPYIRLSESDAPSIRSMTPLVKIGEETIRWYWKHAGAQDPEQWVRHLTEKQRLLGTSIYYLRDFVKVSWYLVLEPQVPGSFPFMAEPPVDTFVGRVSDLQKLHEIISNWRVGAITGIVGTGGIGKTELARKYAKEYRSEYPGGIYWVSLKASTWRSEATKIIESVCPGSSPVVFADDVSAKEAVRQALMRKDALLIIDNVNEADEIIKKTECSILITTRNRGVFGLMHKEAIRELEEFETDEGLELLEKVLGKERVIKDIQAARHLVEVLGGMPLAVDIAAWHLNYAPDLKFTDYIGEVQGRIKKLEIRGVEDKSVFASLELSLEHLKKEEHGDEMLILFEAIGVCAETGFTSEALVASAGLSGLDPHSQSTLVGGLYRRSILKFNSYSKRYFMHPLVRQMAEEKIKEAKGRLDFFRDNHSNYFLNYAKAHANSAIDIIREKDGLWQSMIQVNQMNRGKQLFPQFLEYLTRPCKGLIEKSGYEVAFMYLAQMNLINISALGLSKELISFLTPFLENQNAINEKDRAILYNRFGEAYDTLSDYHKSIEFYKKSLEIHRRIGDLLNEGVDLGNMGIAFKNFGDYHKGIEFIEKALEIHRRIGDARGEGYDLGNMGIAFINLGDCHKGIEFIEKALEIHRRIGDARGEGNDLSNMGIAYKDLGEYPKAIGFQEKALEIHRRIGDLLNEGNDLLEIGIIYNNLRECRKGIEFLEKALEIHRRIGDLQGEGYDLDNIGIPYINLGDYRKGIEFLKKALEIHRRIGDARGEGHDLFNMGLAYSMIGSIDRSLECFRASKGIFHRLGHKHMVEKIIDMMKATGVGE